MLIFNFSINLAFNCISTNSVMDTNYTYFHDAFTLDFNTKSSFQCQLVGTVEGLKPKKPQMIGKEIKIGVIEWRRNIFCVMLKIKLKN